LPRIVSFEAEPPVLRCAGEEDAATQSLRRGAFARAVKASGDVVVDLSELVFADASLTFDLAILAQKLRKRERKLLLRDAQPQIAKLFELVGLSSQPGVLVTA
jgi:anti-anti-sigma regulatory factor